MTKQEFNKVLNQLTDMSPNVYGNDIIDVFGVANAIEKYTGDSYYNQVLSFALSEGWIEETA